MRVRSRRLVAALGMLACGVLLATTVVAVVTVHATQASAATPVLGRTVIGYSVRHRPIVAYHLGDPHVRRVSVLLGQMHGDEHAGVTVARSLIAGRTAVEGINLWVVPTMNPDGDAAHTRQNAHHVDLNRNWPDHWAHLTGQYYSGRAALTEPETRAMYRFLLRVKPHYLLSLHQPLHGVDTTDGGGLDHAFRSRLVRSFRLPAKAFRCWSFCHGSMTGWYTTHRYGIGETVEFGWHPQHRYLVDRARWAVVHSLGGHFGSLAAHNPRSSLRLRASVGRVRLYGWAFDIDSRRAHVHLTVSRDGHPVRHLLAAGPSPAANARYHVIGRHGARLDVPAPPGRHRICVVYRNIRAGTANPRRCATITVPRPRKPKPATHPPTPPTRPASTTPASTTPASSDSVSTPPADPTAAASTSDTSTP